MLHQAAHVVATRTRRDIDGAAIARLHQRAVFGLAEAADLEQLIDALGVGGLDLFDDGARLWARLLAVRGGPDDGGWAC